MLPVPIHDSLLTPTDATALAGISDQLHHAYRTRQLWRTETEMRVSVLDDLHFPTPAAKYWQAVREQCVFLEQLMELSFEFRRNEVKLKRAQIAAKSSDPLAAEEALIAVDECAFREKSMRLAAIDRVREITLWETLKNEQIAVDPTFDRHDVNAHQLVSYTTQFVLRAAHADASQMNGAELDNLLGQLRTAVRRCEETGVLPQVLAGLPTGLAALVEQQKCIRQ